VLRVTYLLRMTVITSGSSFEPNNLSEQKLGYVIRFEKRGNLAQNPNFFTTFQTVTFTDTVGLLLYRSNVKSYSMPPVSSSEPPK